MKSTHSVKYTVLRGRGEGIRRWEGGIKHLRMNVNIGLTYIFEDELSEIFKHLYIKSYRDKYTN